MRRVFLIQGEYFVLGRAVVFVSYCVRVVCLLAFRFVCVGGSGYLGMLGITAVYP